MKPTIGRMVIVHGISSNGSHEHPAVITRVWNSEKNTVDGAVRINVTVFPDTAPPLTLQSINLYNDLAESMVAVVLKEPVAYWPSRISISG